MKEDKKHRLLEPPALARRVLIRFLRDDLLEEVQGDLEEKFQRTVQERSVLRAKINYCYQVLNYLRPFAMRKSRSLNQYDMFQNHFIIGWRSLLKQKMYSAIKVGGFALGIAACLLIALFIRDELCYDLHYTNGARLYRAVEVFVDRGKIERATWHPAPMASALKQDFPEIEKAGRYNSSELFGAGANQVRRDDQTENTYEEHFVFADQELLEILEVPVLYGNPAHLLDEPNTMVITQSKADKYFPGESPVGRLMIVNNDVKNPFRIGGVIEDFPAHSHLSFDFIITMKGREFWPGEQNYWGATNYQTYILLREGTGAADLQAKMQRLTEKYVLPLWQAQGRADVKDLTKNLTYELQPVRDIHLRSDGIDDPLNHGDIRFVWLFGAVALFILIIASINFINLSTAKSANRAKEVGLRKTVGSHRSNIVNQFLVESMLYSVLSFAAGLMLAWMVLPYFNSLSGKSMTIPWTVWWFAPAMLVSSVVIGMVAGVYPSLYLSSFKPVDVLKGNFSRGSKNSFTRSALVVFQFTTSIVLIIATVVIYRQMNYLLTRDAGFDKDQVVMIQGTGTVQNIRTFKNELLALSGVKHASISDYLPIRSTKRNGNGFYLEGHKKLDQAVAGQFWVVDPDYVRTLGMKIVAGRDFREDPFADTANVIINQAMAKKLGLKDPIDKRIENYRGWNVIGVVEDFNFESMRDRIEPLAMIVGLSPGIVSVKVHGADMHTVLSSIEAVWKRFSPNQAIRYSFLDDSFARMYEDVYRLGRIFTVFAALAIVVACLGLFALSAFMIEQRSKEISIRLVLGASLKSVFSLLTLNFVRLVLIAIAIAIPLAWYLMDRWLLDFEYKTDITWDIFAWAGAIAVLIALITISYQSFRAALVNPAKNLRSE